jgi:hypothetical protein
MEKAGLFDYDVSDIQIESVSFRAPFKNSISKAQ